MRNCLIIVNTFKTEASPLGTEVKLFLQARGIQCTVFSYDGSAVEPPTGYFDFVVTLGGDGTVLFAARFCAPKHIPIFSVNLGNFGFIAGVEKDCWKQELTDYIEGKMAVQKRSLLTAAVERNGRQMFTALALNDIVVSAKMAVHLVNIDVCYNDAPLGKFKSDGIIVSTSTGSTAYSAACGGPIVAPSVDALILTPMNSFSLSSRPLVLGGDGVLTMTVLPSRAGLAVTADGQIPFELKEGDKIKINLAKDIKAELVCSNEGHFFAALRSKLNWSGGPHA